jgi:hypothetical protein
MDPDQGTSNVLSYPMDANYIINILEKKSERFNCEESSESEYFVAAKTSVNGKWFMACDGQSPWQKTIFGLNDIIIMKENVMTFKILFDIIKSRENSQKEKCFFYCKTRALLGPVYYVGNIFYC